MKVILTASRHQSFNRPAFFRHLREVHWPLVRRYPAVLECIQGYTQNHSFLAEEDGGVPTPWRRASERDSVIEVWFDGMESLARMDADPDYVAHVRPDEARFNNLSNNVLLVADEQVYHRAPRSGRIKRFDFLYGTADCDPRVFQEKCRSACLALALDPLFQALADGQSLHLPFALEAVEATMLQAMVATNTSGLDAMSRLAARRFVDGFGDVDHDRSFSVLATSFPKYPEPAR